MITCPLCRNTSDAKDWRDTEVACEDCGDHPAVVCPVCFGVIDVVMNPDPTEGDN